MLRVLAVFAVVFVGGLFCQIAAQAAIPPAGYQILAQSAAQYTSNGNQFSVVSAPISTRVLPVFSLQLSPPGDVGTPAFTLQGIPGDTLYATFTVTNLGNARDSIGAFGQAVPPSTASLAQVVFFLDANGNGRVDPGEDDPTLFALDAGSSLALSVAFVLTAPVGDTYVEAQVSSLIDPSPVTYTSVALITTNGLPGNTLHLGPRNNAVANPGGEGSADDETTMSLGYADNRVVFLNDIANLDVAGDVVELAVADTTGWPAGLTVTFRDSAGAALPSAPRGLFGVRVGALSPGESQTIQTEVTTTGLPLSAVLSDSLSIRLLATSRADTTRMNSTIDRIIVPSADVGAVIALDQTFRENSAAFGDVVTLVVTVRNISDSLDIANVTVRESVQATLNFLSSPTFDDQGGYFTWDVGSLRAGEQKEAAIKLVANSRVAQGKVKATGYADGVAATTSTVSVGPVINTLRIVNDIFGDEGIVLGEVFYDDNLNGERDAGEAGVRGAAVYMESGEYALTDSVGKFSIQRVFSGFRVVRLDEATLPPRTQAGSPGDNRPRTVERLVHLLPSGNAAVSFPVYRVLDPPEFISRQIVAQELVSVQKERRVIYQVPAVPSSVFESGESYLKTGYDRRLRPIVAFLNTQTQWIVVIEGHTDSIPIHTEDFPSNYELSLSRANAVKRYLTAAGLPERRIRVKGYGDTRPVDSNATAEGRMRNRRVEVGFLPADYSDEHDPFAFERVAASARNLAQAPDTFRVRIVWDFSTDCPRPMYAALGVGFPEGIRDPRVTIRHAGEVVRLRDPAYLTQTFARSNGIQCEVYFEVPETDTALVRLVQPVIEFDWPVDAIVPDGAVGMMPYGFKTNPLAHGRSNGNGRVFTVYSWTEVDTDEGTPQTIAEDAITLEAMPAFDEDDFGIIDPVDGAVFSKADRIPIQVRVPLGSKVELSTNGVPVGEDRVGNKVIDLTDKVEVIVFYGVQIATGWNTIVLKASPVSGDAVIDTLRVAMAGKPGYLKAMRERVVIPANGQAGATLRFALQDMLQLPVADGVVATVVSGDSVLLSTDARPDMRGLQVMSVDGFYDLDVKSSQVTGKTEVVLETHGLRASSMVSYVPAERAVFATGVLEGRVGAFSSSGDADPLGLEGFGEDTKLDGDARLFLQGTGYGGVNLTARVDSKKRYDDPILKMVNPERQYPLYGDKSETHFAAPAQSGNYVALEKDESFVSYGDFRTPTEEGEFLRYKRTATGVNGKLASGEHGLKGFVTKTDLSTHRDEIPADGTSGFYYLDHAPVVENSEQVWIEVRDRFQSERRLQIFPMVQYRDYTINQQNGAILFKYPVDAFTRELDPVTIVVVYEVESDEEGHYLYGARGDLVKTGQGRVGATAITRGGAEFDYALYGADASVNIGRLHAGGEFARSEDDLAGEGNAYKLDAGYRDENSEHSVFYREVEENFLNPSFTGGTTELGSRKFGYDGRVDVNDKLKLKANAFRHQFSKTDEEKDNLAGIAAFDDGRYLASAGVRAANEDLVQRGENSALLSMLGAGVRAKGRFDFKTHWEHNLKDEVTEDWPDRLTSKLVVPVSQRFRLTGNHEYLSARGRPATHQFLAGVEGKLGAGLSTFTKYSMNRTASDERMGAVMGVQQKLQFSDGVKGNIDLEGFRSLSEREDEEYVSFRTGLNWLQPDDATLEAQYEYRWQRTNRRHLVRFNGLKQFDNDSALMLKQATSFMDPSSGDMGIRSEGRIGALYRPVYTPVRWLVLLKNDYDRFSPVDPEAITWRLVFSTDFNIFLARQHELRLKLAAKRMESYSNSISASSNNALLLGQYVWRFAHKWDVDLWARYMDQGGIGTREVGTGAEIGHMFFGRIRVAAGYSFNGFEERDMAENDAWAQGFGVRVQLILSEWIVNELGLRNEE